MVRKLPRQTDYFSSGAFLAWRCKNETFPVQAASGKSAALPFFFWSDDNDQYSILCSVLCTENNCVFCRGKKDTVDHDGVCIHPLERARPFGCQNENARSEMEPENGA